MAKKIIGLAGRKQSGKSTAAERLVNSGFIRLSFAYVMRDMLTGLLINCGFSPHEIQSMFLNDKEQPIVGIGKSPRQLMQLLGTDWGRHLVHEDIWVMAACNKLERMNMFDIVFDDVRFENEATMIRSRGGRIIHIVRNDGDFDNHVSEAGILRHPADELILNDGSLSDLFKKLSIAMK